MFGHKINIIFILILLINLNLPAQDVLIVEKFNKRKNIQFRENDPIMLSIKGESERINGRIASISDSVIVLKNRIAGIALDDIRCVWTVRTGFPFLSELFIKAGIGYALVGLTNQMISGEGKTFFKYPLIIGPVLIATGLLFGSFDKNRHTLEKGKWRIIILNFADPEQNY